MPNTIVEYKNNRKEYLSPEKKAKRLFLQPFVDRDTVAFSGLCAPEENDLKRFVDTLTPFVEKIALRGG